MEKTKKIIAIVAATLVVLAGGLGVGYKLWFGEEMPVVETEAVVETVDSVETVLEVVADTVEEATVDTTVAE